MKVYEFFEINQFLFTIAGKNNMAISDVKYIKMYQDYNAMLEKGYKKAYIVALLKDEYNINERTVYRIIERFQKEVKL